MSVLVSEQCQSDRELDLKVAMKKTGDTKFVNSLFLRNLIQTQCDESDVKIKAYDVEPASTESNSVNARSSMNRILVKYSSSEAQDRTITFVVKIKPRDGVLAEEFKKTDVFEKEIHFYKTVIPNMAKIIKVLGLNVDLAPGLVHTSEVPTDLLVLEDLTNLGYCIESQEIGLSLEQSKMAFEKLAFFHASSAMILSERPGDLAKLSRGTFHSDYKNKLNYFNDALKAVVDNATVLGISQRISDKLKMLHVKTVEKAIEGYTSNFKGLQVLNHGDFWTNNIMYKYEGTQLVDAIFLDFQNCVVGSPIIDLTYFLSTSVAYDVLRSSRDELIFTYYETLSLLLEKLGYPNPIPKLIELQTELLRRGSLEVIFALTTAPYLRTKGAQNIPVIQPSLHKADDKQPNDFKSVLVNHSRDINQQLQAFDSNGLLDWGVAESKIKNLMGRFQR